MEKRFNRVIGLFSICCLIGLLVISSCARGTETKSSDTQPQSIETDNTIEDEYWPTDTWKTKEPDPQTVDVQQLDEVEKKLGDSKVKSMVIVHDGYIISEFYREGDPSRLYSMNSVTKSVTSVLLGIAMDEGKIKGIDERLVDFFPEYADAFDSEAKKSITLEHVLSMTSGLDWREWTDWNFSIPWGGEDWNLFVLQRPMAFEPGTVWNYSTGGSQLLAAIIKKTTGQSEYDYGMAHLFKPLGISDIDWTPSEDGSNSGGFGLKMTARDLAKIGFLYLNGGMWDGQRIVSEQWVKDSTSIHANGTDAFGTYGYHWWNREFNGHQAYFGMGYAGQYLTVVPDLDLVMVFFSDANGAEDTLLPLEYMEDIVKAMDK